MPKKNEIVPAEQEQVSAGFGALKNANLAKMMSEEFKGLDLTLDRIKVPSGGGTVFELVDDDPDDPETIKEFSAVVLYHHAMQVYYRGKFAGGSEPPDCISYDGETGEGDPGGRCADCPMNRFGTGENDSKACKARRSLYLLREGERLPVTLSLPQGSVKPFSTYIKRLYSKKGLNSNEVVTRFSLKRATNKTGAPYSQGQFSLDRELTPDEKQYIDVISAQMQEYSKSVAFNYNDVRESDDAILVDDDEDYGMKPF